MTDDEIPVVDQQRALVEFLASFAAGMVNAGQQRQQVATGMAIGAIVQQLADQDTAATAAWLRDLADRVARLDATLPTAELIDALLAPTLWASCPEGPGGDVVRLDDRRPR